MSDVLADLLNLARTFAGRQAQPEDRIYADLDINGSDFIEFVATVERRYEVDLAWVSPRDSKEQATDPTIGALAENISDQLQPSRE